MRVHTIVSVTTLLIWGSLQSSAQTAPDGNALYQQNCATCHGGPNGGGLDRAPTLQSLRAMSADRVLAAMESGPMISMASRRTAQERRIIAEFVSAKALTGKLEMTPPPEAFCASNDPDMFYDAMNGPLWTGWGNASNTRFQDEKNAGFKAADVPKLKVKWAFAFPGDQSANAQPTIAGGRVFVGSAGGMVYSLDASTGCVHWAFKAESTVRSAIAIAKVQAFIGERYVAFFGDNRANFYAVDAATGKQYWKVKVDDFDAAGILGSPVVYKDRVYFGVKSGEEALAGADPKYECCRFRGSLVALNTYNGRYIWKTFLVDEPQKTKKNAAGAQLWGPSGVPIWSSPVVDTRKNLIYATTGNNYSDPTTRYGDSIVAFNLDTGKIVWSHQFTQKDAYTSACRLQDKTNCADSNGPDFDFGSSPILVNLGNGKRALVVGQKSGMVHAVDPDAQGMLLWTTRVAKGGTAGGVQWGSAADGKNMYVAVSDIGRIALTFTTSTDADPTKGGGIFALNLRNGEKVWYTGPQSCGNRPRCSPAQSAAVSAIPGVVFSGSEDGHLRGYSTANGKIVWDVDTEMDYKTVNGVEGHGGSIDGPGPAIGGGMLFVNSGYVAAGGAPGNVMLAFSVDGK